MELNADFTERAVVHGERVDWVSSPMAGVSRRMLDRIGGEVARATSIVRFDPDSRFSPHVHTGGEEFFVLEGVFEDEHGAFPAGAYIRNPPQSSHTPGSGPGCTILVKLWQFDLADRTHVRIATDKLGVVADRERAGVAIQPLFSDGREDVRIEHWQPGAEIRLDPVGGIEIFVLAGGFEEGGEQFERHSWLRLPIGAALAATAGEEGARVWVKSGHLRFAGPPTSV